MRKRLHIITIMYNSNHLFSTIGTSNNNIFFYKTSVRLTEITHTTFRRYYTYVGRSFPIRSYNA